MVKIGIVGIGMVGAPLARWFGEKGYKRGEDLFCFDVDQAKNCRDDFSQANIVFICVPTPSQADGYCDTSIVESVIANLPDRERVIVIKSTVPPGTTYNLSLKYKSKGSFLFNPEFLTEAQAWSDFSRPHRQIVAYSDSDSKKWVGLVLSLLPAAFFISPGVSGTYNFHNANTTEAELAKYGGNVFGAVKVALFNIYADFCRLLGIDYENVRRLVSQDSRINDSWTNVFHGNYRGFGGYCFPKDLNALIGKGEELLQRLESKEREVFYEALNVLKSVRSYNNALLQSQGLTMEEVSAHNYKKIPR